MYVPDMTNWNIAKTWWKVECCF
uniref:Uncharacterized protein n=1 Tax=Anguilla anguilla TaxID=7936 RepID=A0A0E9Q0S6_ANGAN